MQNYDVCVIGAGPAGMKAAVQCARYGARVLLLDEQPSPGGQIYRAVGQSQHTIGPKIGSDYLYGMTLVKALEERLSQKDSRLTFENQAVVWRIDDNRQVYFSRSGKSDVAKARHIIIATGAIERSFPFNGWTLPGVMTAGAAQILLKTSQVVPQRAVLVGTGPLLYLLGAQMIDVGVPPLAIVDTLSPRNYLKALRYVGSALVGYRYVLKGIGLLRKIHRAGVPHYTQVTDIQAEGKQCVESISFRSGNKLTKLDTSTLLCHVGVIPNTQLTRALDIEHRWDDIQHSWKPKLDSKGETSISGISVIGDSGGIGGAKVSELQGELTAMSVLSSLEIVPSDKLELRRQELSRLINKELRIRPFLDVLYAPPYEALNPDDSTVVCRCEEVKAGEIRELARKGCDGINQIKAMTRCGMGPCQGRYCGGAVSDILAKETGRSVQDIGYYRIRHPIKPLKLRELASVTPKDESFSSLYYSKEVTDETSTASINESANE